MFLGHFAVALAAKRVAPKTSLGTLTAAAQWVDLIWPALLLLGVERVEIDPGNTRVTPLAFTSYPFTHSLLAVMVWAALGGGVYYAWKRDVRPALVVGAVVLSHWVLDLVVHAPDLLLVPGWSLKVGLGLWNSVLGTVVVEFGLLAAGLWMYLRATRARDRVGSWGLAGYALLLVSIYLANLLGPAPPSARAIGFAGLALWLFALWAWWLDRHREPEPAGATA